MKKIHISIVIVVIVIACWMAFFYLKKQSESGVKNSSSFEVQKQESLKKKEDHSSKIREEKKDIVQVVQDKKKNRFQVYGLKEIDKAKLLANGKDANLPSTARVFVVAVKAKEIKTMNLKIVKATLTATDHTVYQAEGTSISTKTMMNIVGQDLNNFSQGMLFFIALDPGHTLKNGKGTMTFTLSNQEIVTLDVEF
ncbi:hypothetical protein [Bulleidia extructa]|uniref:hypothetical protein n=1 Tax=Bulleidia extructa TaxID=118748 RepID=UPI002352659F|nr:hypothetical protein [Bulleidia extructa]